MFTNITKINMEDRPMSETVPAYLCLLMMTLSYSIAEGISFGMISYVLLNVVCGTGKEVKPLLYVLSVLFICKYIFL
jgi:AGZA family xanthine/uracil permease-like MFS transporter